MGTKNERDEFQHVFEVCVRLYALLSSSSGSSLVAFVVSGET